MTGNLKGCEPVTAIEHRKGGWRNLGVSPERAFAAVVALSIALRLVALVLGAREPLVSDSTDYREMAALLASGARFLPYWPPGLPLYLAPFLAAGFGDAVLRAAMLLWWLLFCWGTWRLVVDLGVKRIGWLVLLVFAIAPTEIHFSMESMTQMPAAALLLIAASAALRCARGAGWGEALLLGVSLGYLSLVRPSVLPLLVVIPALVFLRRRRLAGPIAAMLIGGAMIFGWMARVHQLSGVWTVNTSNGVNLYYGNNPWTPMYRTWYFGSHAKPGSEEILEFPEYAEIMERVSALPRAKRSAEYQRLAVSYVTHAPGAFVLRTLNRVRCFWGFDTFTAANLRSVPGWMHRLFVPVLALDALCFLAIVGFAVYWLACAPGVFWLQWDTWLLGGTVVLYSLPYWVTMSHPTYHFPVMAPLALLGVKAREASAASLRAPRWHGWLGVTALGLIQVEWMFYLAKG
ncbi:hypothetical protein [Edaphobacter aggregans]|uniref:hypothetical protein n=1 Tax=Edaphobacter aggregans TaxID=570835 RepID=UPI00055933ED|nr:hypothetical protein [Edaphobacter aggregans]